MSSRAAFLTHECGRGWPDQAPADDLIMEHAIARIETELRWHDAVLDRIGKLAAGGAPADAAPADAAPVGTATVGTPAVGTAAVGTAPARAGRDRSR